MPSWSYVILRSARRARLEGRNARPQLIRLALEQGGEKRLGLVLVLLAQQGAGGVDEPAAGFYQARGAGQDVALADHQLGEVVRGGAPLPVGIAAPAADPETGRVDE